MIPSARSLRVRMRTVAPYLQGGQARPFEGWVDRTASPTTQHPCMACGAACLAGVPRWRTRNSGAFCEQCVAEAEPLQDSLFEVPPDGPLFGSGGHVYADAALTKRLARDEIEALGIVVRDPADLPRSKVEFLTGLFAAWEARAAGRAQPNASDKSRARAAAHAALFALQESPDPPGQAGKEEGMKTKQEGTDAAL